MNSKNHIWDIAGTLAASVACIVIPATLLKMKERHCHEI